MARIWGGGISDEDNPDLEDLMITEDNAADSFLVDHEILGLISYHLELSKSGILPSFETADILKSLLNLLENKPKSVSGYEDVHSLVDSRINEMSAYGSDLRIFLSRNDQSHFDIRSFYIEGTLDISLQLVQISSTLRKSFENSNGYMPGYTHYRQAMPVSFHTYFDYLSLVFADLAEDSLLLHKKFSLNSPLGYGSGYGSPLPVNMEKVGQSLGFRNTFQNPMHGSYFRGLDDAEMSFLLAKILLAISRVSQDLIMYSSDEFGFLSLPGGYTTGSSLMPNKKNPDFLEMLQGYAAESAGTLFTVFSTILNKGSGYHRELQLSKDKAMAFTQRTLKILKAMEPLFAGISLNEQKAKAAVKNSTYATMAAYGKFKEDGKWKDAYRFVGTTLKQGGSVPEYEPDSYRGADGKHLSELKAGILNLMDARKDQISNLIISAEEFIANLAL